MSSLKGKWCVFTEDGQGKAVAVSSKPRFIMKDQNGKEHCIPRAHDQLNEDNMEDIESATKKLQELNDIPSGHFKRVDSPDVIKIFDDLDDKMMRDGFYDYHKGDQCRVISDEYEDSVSGEKLVGVFIDAKGSKPSRELGGVPVRHLRDDSIKPFEC